MLTQPIDQQHQFLLMAKKNQDISQKQKSIYLHEDLSTESHMALTTADSLQKNSLSTNRECLKVSPFVTFCSPDVSTDQQHMATTNKSSKNKVISDRLDETQMFLSPQTEQPEIDYFFENFDDLIKITYLTSQIPQKSSQLSQSANPRDYSTGSAVRTLLPFFDKARIEDQAPKNDVWMKQDILSSVKQNSQYSGRARSSTINFTSSSVQSVEPNKITSALPQPPQVPSYLFPKPISFPQNGQDSKQGRYFPIQSSLSSKANENLNSQFENPALKQQQQYGSYIISQPSLTSLQQKNEQPTSELISSNLGTVNFPTSSTRSQCFEYPSGNSAVLPPQAPLFPNNSKNYQIKSKEGNLENSNFPQAPLPQSNCLPINSYNTNHVNSQKYKYRNSLKEKSVDLSRPSNNMNSSFGNNTLILNNNSNNNSYLNNNNSNINNNYSQNFNNNKQIFNQSVQIPVKNPSGSFFHTPSQIPRRISYLQDSNQNQDQNSVYVSYNPQQITPSQQQQMPLNNYVNEISQQSFNQKESNGIALQQYLQDQSIGVSSSYQEKPQSLKFCSNQQENINPNNYYFTHNNNNINNNSIHGNNQQQAHPSNYYQQQQPNSQQNNQQIFQLNTKPPLIYHPQSSNNNHSLLQPSQKNKNGEDYNHSFLKSFQTSSVQHNEPTLNQSNSNKNCRPRTESVQITDKQVPKQIPSRMRSTSTTAQSESTQVNGTTSNKSLNSHGRPGSQQTIRVIDSLELQARKLNQQQNVSNKENNSYLSNMNSLSNGQSQQNSNQNIKSTRTNIQASILNTLLSRQSQGLGNSNSYGPPKIPLAPKSQGGMSHHLYNQRNETKHF